MEAQKVIDALAEKTREPVRIALAGFPSCSVTIPAGWWYMVGQDGSEEYWSPSRFAHVFNGKTASQEEFALQKP